MIASRLPIVGVMGSGRESHPALAEPLGRWLARQGVHLLTGGGQGVMAAVSRAFYETANRRGLVIGVLPCADEPAQAKPGYPNDWVELPLRTHLPLSGVQGQDKLSRNHINILTSDVIVALPGGAGTASEIALAIKYGKPTIAYVASPCQAEGLASDIPAAFDLETVGRFVGNAIGGPK